MKISRRDFGKIAVAALPTATVAATLDSRVEGVQIGVISYSFRDLPAEQIIPAMVKIGLGEVELMSNHAETLAGAPAPRGRGDTKGQEDLKEWRRSARPEAFQRVRKQFQDAGIDLRLLCYNLGANTTDDEIDYSFRMARALGARAISSSSRLSVARRVAPFAERYALPWGAHGHDNVSDPEEFATPEVFAKVMALNKYMGVNLDIGHFTAAGYDAVAYIREHHDRITNLHLKDRKKNPPGGTSIRENNWPWGQGDTPIKAVLQLLKTQKYDIPANIEYEYNAHATGGSVTEVARCFEYARKALEQSGA
ncbi:MAG TPA: sugar phosphate isomerase/epimerase [Bryobacteraceae bacterium]|nr:sugar phosphate isomerase/epimerase [Bryobacteraceae bacterium]